MSMEEAICVQSRTPVREDDLRKVYPQLERDYGKVTFYCPNCMELGQYTDIVACACKEGVEYVVEKPYFRAEKEHHKECPYSQSSSKTVTHNEIEQAGLDSNKCDEVLKRLLQPQAGFKYNPVDLQEYDNEIKYILNQLVKSCREHNNKTSSKKNNFFERIIQQKEINSFANMSILHYNLIRDFIINHSIKNRNKFDNNFRLYIDDIKRKNNIINFSVAGYSDIEYINYFKTVKEIVTIDKPLPNEFIAFGSIQQNVYFYKGGRLIYFNDKYNGLSISIYIEPQDLEHLIHKKKILDRISKDNIDNLLYPIIYCANYKKIDTVENRIGLKEYRITANPKHFWIADSTDFI